MHALNSPQVCEYLLGQQYKYSLSVFLAESGTHKLPALSHADLLRLVGVAPGSKLHSLVLARSAAGDGSGGCGGCLAAGIVEALPHVEACAPTLSAACQTDEPPAVVLTARLAAVEREFLQRSEAVERQSARVLEERVAECQRACEARYAEQLRAQVARVREAEVGAAREAEAARHERLLAAECAALQRAHQEQLDKLRAQVGGRVGRRADSVGQHGSCSPKISVPVIEWDIAGRESSIMSSHRGVCPPLLEGGLKL